MRGGRKRRVKLPNPRISMRSPAHILFVKLGLLLREGLDQVGLCHIRLAGKEQIGHAPWRMGLLAHTADNMPYRGVFDKDALR